MFKLKEIGTIMKLRYLLILVGLLSLGLFSSPVKAGGDVSVCDEANLLSALSGGGLVTFSCSGTITISAPISIDEDTVVDASGQNVIISGGNSYKVLYTSAVVTLRNITIADGHGGVYTSGGGIINSGTLLLDGVTVHDNAAGSGGGIRNSGQITITDSMIQYNSSFSGGSGFGGNGAGIYNIADGTAFISNSTFRSNSSHVGGAIYNLSGTIDIVNSTFYENYTIPSDGGAIYNSDDGTINIVNTTFSRNKAGQYGNGSGIDNSGAGSVTLTNSIVAYSQQGDNCQGTITDGGGNLSYPDSTCPGVNLDPVLETLQDNGGATLTTALLNGSSAIDNAINSVCNNAPVNGLDQRGVTRPIGESCDIGAFESDATPPAPDFILDLNPNYAAMCLTDSATFDLDVLSVAGFNSSVDLSVDNLPTGMAATFDNDPVIPTASSELTISDTGTASVGNYVFDVVGTSITQTHTISAYLYVYDTVPNIQPTLLAPADGSTDVDLRPTFSWDSIQDAIYYSIEVATDMQFTNVVYSRTLLATSVTPANDLQESTVHYWRVKASNNCGEGPFSEVYSFTTLGTSPTPDFTIDASPATVSVCSPQDAIFEVSLVAVDGFNEPVMLSVNGIPNEMPRSFDNNPVMPSGSSELTIDTTSSTGSADYDVEVVGASSTITHSTFVSLDIDGAAPGSAPTLLSPTNGMTDTAVMPTFSWQAVAAAAGYKLEVATDSGFSNVVLSTTVAETNYSVTSPLAENTLYFWRVTPENTCGDGPSSAVFNFTTESNNGSPTNFIYMPVIIKPN